MKPCRSGKLAYENFGAAQRALRALGSRRGYKQSDIAAYRCPTCRQIHLGRPKRGPVARRRELMDKALEIS